MNVSLHLSPPNSPATSRIADINTQRIHQQKAETSQLLKINNNTKLPFSQRQRPPHTQSVAPVTFTLIQEHDLDSLQMFPHAKNEVPGPTLTNIRPIHHRQTDRCDRTHYDDAFVSNKSPWRFWDFQFGGPVGAMVLG